MLKKILILDDDPQLLEELKGCLENEYQVFTLQNSKSALEAAVEIKPDVILLDVEMPGESGLQIASKIMYFSDLRSEIIVMSGREERHKAVAQLCGFKGFLLKPFDYEELRSTLEAPAAG